MRIQSVSRIIPSTETNPKQTLILIAETMNDNIDQLSHWFLIASQIYSESQISRNQSVLFKICDLKLYKTRFATANN